MFSRPVRQVVLSLSLTVVCAAHAEITLDGSVGPPGSLPGPNYVIPAEAGSTVGSNLFHSFGVFNVFMGQGAVFTGPASVSNIISRVTGGKVSNVDGLLLSAIPNANFFLLNPAGVMFGPNATLLIDGSFHVSTANYLSFADGSRFTVETNPAANPLLTSEPPSAFGFLGNNPSPITATSSWLFVPPERTLSLVGGDVTVTGVSTLSAPGGQINIASVRSPGEVPIAPGGFDAASLPHLGSIRISDASEVNTSGDNGRIFIRGGVLTLDDGAIIGQVGARGGIDIVTSERIEINANASAEARSAGILSTALLGDAGAISVKTRNLEMGASGRIFGKNESDASAANILVNVTRLAMSNGALIDSSSLASPGEPPVTGKGGDITVMASESIAISGRDPVTGLSTAIQSGTNTGGAGGAITIKARELSLESGSIIAVDSSGPGNAGDVEITLSDAFRSRDASVTAVALIKGGGNIKINAPNLVHLRNSTVSTSVGEDGNGGNILIDPKFVVLDNGSRIIANAVRGQGGNISIRITDDGAFLRSPDSVVQASSDFGVQGSVVIDSPDTDVTSGVSGLPVSFFDASALVADRCATRVASSQSSFVVTGRGAVPPGPAMLQGAFYFDEVSEPNDAESESARSSPNSPASIEVPAMILGCSR